MEVLSPASYVSKTPWLIDTRKNTKWTQQENKMFENALAYYDKDTPDRWHKVAEMIPGKTAEDVKRQYQELVYDVRNIEAGLVRVPEYGGSQFTLEWVSHNGCGSGAKRGPSSRGSDHERKKGIPWTEEEHRLFLMGLKKYGKGDWRNISRNFVMTRTPTQVASHAQKYFIRQLSGGKDKRRASIHDITTVTLDTNQVPSPDARRPSSPEHSTVTVQPPQRRPGSIPKFPTFPWDRAGSGLGHVTGSMFISPYGMQGQNLHDHHDGCHGMGMAFQMQATEHYPHG